jgi:hypothetical protein
MNHCAQQPKQAPISGFPAGLHKPAARLMVDVSMEAFPTLSNKANIVLMGNIGEEKTLGEFLAPKGLFN